MRRLIFLLIFIGLGYSASAQSHRMKYYYDDEREGWRLQDSTSYRNDMSVVKPDGTPGDPKAALVQCITGTTDIELVRSIVTPAVLTRYKQQGLEDFGITYIILPDGTVDEVNFGFCGYNGKLNIPEADMFLWRQLSDALKQQVKFRIPEISQQLQFYRAARFLTWKSLRI